MPQYTLGQVDGVECSITIELYIPSKGVSSSKVEEIRLALCGATLTCYWNVVPAVKYHTSAPK